MKGLLIGVLVKGSNQTYTLKARLDHIDPVTQSQAFDVDCLVDNMLKSTIRVNFPHSLLSGGNLLDMGIYTIHEVKNDFWWNLGVLVQRHIVGVCVETFEAGDSSSVLPPPFFKQAFPTE